ncbi:MAG: glycosyltransferase, partial [Candidatus Portnoybacteria bacterium]|nr:glycosyltransferase [Candidatus Portnoybacteria bacterium]
MKITIASGIYPPDIGGPATYSRLIAREFTKKGIDVNVVCYGDKKQKTKDKEQSFPIKKISRKNKKPTRYFKYLLALLKTGHKSDVIYAQGPLSAGLPAMWASKILNKKFVIKIVGDYAWEQAVNQYNVKDSIIEFQNKKYSKKVERIRKIQNKTT